MILNCGKEIWQPLPCKVFMGIEIWKPVCPGDNTHRLQAASPSSGRTPPQSWDHLPVRLIEDFLRWKHYLWHSHKGAFSDMTTIHEGILYDMITSCGLTTQKTIYTEEKNTFTIQGLKDCAEVWATPVNQSVKDNTLMFWVSVTRH